MMQTYLLIYNKRVFKNNVHSEVQFNNEDILYCHHDRISVSFLSLLFVSWIWFYGRPHLTKIYERKMISHISHITCIHESGFK